MRVGIESIKGCIYADEIFIFRQDVTSLALIRLKSGNRMLSLPSSKVIRDRCPNQLIGNGESRGLTPFRALCPGGMSSPCFQSFGSISAFEDFNIQTIQIDIPVQQVVHIPPHIGPGYLGGRLTVIPEYF